MSAISKSIYRKRSAADRKPISLLATLTVALLSLFVFVAQPTQVRAQEVPDWTIDSFDAQIEVHDDASLSVTETINVTFNIEKHGIYREIPYLYSGENGNNMNINLKIGAVLQDGQAASVSIYNEGGYKVVRIGDADKTITGKHIYQINYTVDDVFLYYDDHDELYWNVTGTYWEVPIQKSTATVKLPSNTPVTAVSCYTGYYGSTAQECTSSSADNTVSFAADDFLTVAVGFEKGHIWEPSAAYKAAMLIVGLIIIFAPLVIILLILFIIWWKLGRDPKIDKTVIAMYEPPKGLRAVYAGLLTRSHLAKQDITAMIIQLAIEGYLKIDVQEEKKGWRTYQDTTLIKVKEADDKLDEPHTKLMDIIFGKKQETKLSDLKGSVTQTQYTGLKNSIMKKMQDDGYYTKSGFTWQVIFIAVGIMLCFLAFMIGIFFFPIGMTIFIGGVATIIFSFFMPKKTLKGANLAWEVAGFRLFMHTAERYRSAWQEKEHIFFDFLPYAIVFNDAKHWAEVFKDLVYQEPPDWYHSNIPFTTSVAFFDHFSSTTASLGIATIPPAPRSSGGSSGGFSSGGGSSGGGFGGGGGGSW